MPVYKDRQRGTWYISTYIDGKKIVRRGFPTKAEATKEEARLRISKPKTRIKVITLMDDYIAYKKGRVKESTLHTYREYIPQFIEPFFRNRFVASIGYKEAEKFTDSLSSYSANYRNNVTGFVRAAWEYGMRYHGIESNPFVLVERSKTRRSTEMNTWSPEEFLRFYKALTSRRAQIMFLVMYWTGIRKGEMRGLQWTDFDYVPGVLHITKQYSRYGGLTAPKTDSGKRDIDLPTAVNNVLHEWHTEQANIEGFTNDWYIFGDKEPIGLNTITWHWHRGIELSGVKPIRIHDLRHSHASWLFANKFDTAYISHRLGHSSIAITMQVYTHLMDDVAEREKAKIRDTILILKNENP